MVARRPWLEAELDVVDPEVVVALGAVAAASLLDRTVAVGPLRGQPVPWSGTGVLVVTVHTAAVIRTERGAPYDAAFQGFVDDLRLACDQLNA
jgi:DNA polymerase